MGNSSKWFQQNPSFTGVDLVIMACKHIFLRILSLWFSAMWVADCGQGFLLTLKQRHQVDWSRCFILCLFATHFMKVKRGKKVKTRSTGPFYSYNCCYIILVRFLKKYQQHAIRLLISFILSPVYANFQNIWQGLNNREIQVLKDTPNFR